MGVNSSAASAPTRVPPAVDGIQINFCKNPACVNYGVAPSPTVQRGKAGGTPDAYVVSSSGAGVPVLECRSCHEFPPIKSNAGVAEERDRLLSSLAGRPPDCCPDLSCPNHAVPVIATAGHYQGFGVTRAGSRRYRCKVCGKTFAVGKSTTGHKQPHKNRTVFALLMNKSVGAHAKLTIAAH